MTRDEARPGSPLGRVIDWPSFLEEVRRCPGMWLGRPSVAALRHFIDGVRLAEHVYEVPPERLLGGFPFEAFEGWVQERFPGRLPYKSFNIAAIEAGSDQAGFDRWFDWYDEFRSSLTPG